MCWTVGATLFALASLTPAAGLRALRVPSGGQSQADPSVVAVAPIEWVHVPKTGTSFMNTLMHIPGVCPGLRADLRYTEEEYGVNQKEFHRIEGLDLNCNQSLWDTDPERLVHNGIEDKPIGGFSAGKGRFMMFLREPEQQLLSHYHWAEKHGFSSDERALAKRRARSAEESQEFGAMGLLDLFKKMFSGCATKMLTRAQGGCIGQPPSSAEVHEAKIRLQTGFSFVGITERWKLSICLFNKMFNQKCLGVQFANSMPTNGTRQTTYGTAELNGWRDPYDTGLYSTALEIFEANLKKYSVSESSCEPCWREAGVL